MSKHKNRRDFLKQAATLMAVPALTLPFVRSNRANAEEGTPCRLVVVMNSLGVPSAVRSDLYATPVTSPTRLGALKQVLAPLDAHKEQMLVLSGLDYQSALSQDIGGHPGGTGHALTADNTVGTVTNNRTLLDCEGPSIDVAVASGLSAGTPFTSLQLNVGGLRGNGSMGPSFGLDGKQLRRIVGAESAFTTIFGEGSSPEPTVDLGFQAKLDAMGFASAQVRRLQGELPYLNPQRALSAYRDSIDALAQQIEATATLSCEQPGEPMGFATAANLPEAQRRAQIDQMYTLLRHSLACDITRVATLDIGGTSSRLAHPWFDNEGHHGLSHERDDASLRKMAAIRAWYAERLNGFIDQLAATEEGEGTMLDNTVILWTSETSTGWNHSLSDLPLVMIAGKNTGFKQGGWHYNFGGRPHNDLLSAIMQSFGLGDTFGRASLNSSPLDIFG